jgi:hypothetical protein
MSSAKAVSGEDIKVAGVPAGIRRPFAQVRVGGFR